MAMHRAKSASPAKGKKEPRHWHTKMKESIFSADLEGLQNLIIKGGADSGQFCWIGDLKHVGITYHSGKLHPDDIIIEVQDKKVAGYTMKDLLQLLKDLCKNGAPVLMKTIKAGLLTKDLKIYLNTRFQKASYDHEQQQTIRDNLYMRTVPCTTRERRHDEVNGVDYTFLTVEEFLALEKSGNLLESGLYDGNHYGTPKPPKDPTSPPVTLVRNNSMPHIVPLAADSRSSDQDGGGGGGSRRGDDPDDVEELGPLPENWQKVYTEDGTPYFVDHSTETTHWMDPRVAAQQKNDPAECASDELPYGWERVEDPHYGTYYIDHVNRKTQYENPVKKFKDETQDGAENGVINGHSPGAAEVKPFFTKNPDELQGTFIKTVLRKGNRGFGFTIVGGDHLDDEFLQIKNIVPDGPAYTDAKLLTGDVLVYINERCVLGFTHQDVVTLFQGLAVGDVINLEVCRGYPLPFDPLDPNTEIVTTVAVNQPDAMMTSQKPLPHYSDLTGKPFRPLPALADPQQELLSMDIVKGTMGFGFTISDSPYGQKVKQILDKPRCKDLQEGDLLIAIHQHKVKDMSHAEVVNVLKDCPHGQDTRIIVQRGGAHVQNKKKTSKQPKTLSERFGDLHQPQTPPIQKPQHQSDGGRPRSKTPTAEFERNVQRPQQPPPRADFRSKTPTLDLHNNVDRAPFSDKQNVRPGPPQTDFRSKHPAFDQPDFRRPDLPPGHVSRAEVNHYPNDLDRRESRSRTPGPEFMRGGEDQRPPYRTERSKTPTRELFYPQPPHNAIGTPDFVPASRFASSGILPPHSSSQNAPFPPTSQPTMTSSQSVGMNLHNNLVPAPETRRQSTSFEHVEPSAVARPRTDAWEDLARGEDIHVFLRRGDGGFGFRIVGGTEEGSQVFLQVSVGHIVPGGAADRDGRIFTGDELLAVDQQSVVGCSHQIVVQLMGQAAHRGAVQLHLRRRPQRQEASQVSYPYDVTVTRRETEGFGFVIISSVTRSGSTIGRSRSEPHLLTCDWTTNLTRPYPWIGRIIEGSPAERCNRLRVGDRILAVNSVDIVRMHHEDIVNLIKESGFAVTLTVGPPMDDNSSLNSQQNAPVSSQTKQVEAPFYYNDTMPYRRNGGNQQQPDLYYKQHLRHWNHQPPPPRQQSPYQLPADQSDPESGNYYAVELHRGSRGFGFSIRGGKEFNNMPLYVLRIADGGAANMDGRLRVGDQIIEINAFNTHGMTHSEAIDLIQNGGSSVRLLVKRTGKPPPNFGNGTPISEGSPASGNALRIGVHPLSNGPLSQHSPAAGSHTGSQGSDSRQYLPYGPTYPAPAFPQYSQQNTAYH